MEMYRGALVCVHVVTVMYGLFTPDPGAALAGSPAGRAGESYWTSALSKSPLRSAASLIFIITGQFDRNDVGVFDHECNRLKSINKKVNEHGQQ